MSKLSLFRPEAIAFQRDSLASSAALPVPPSPAVLTWSLVLMAFAAAAVLATGSYARKQSVSGFLTTTIGVAKILPPRAGLVVAVTVTEGQLVEAGAPLLTVQVGQTDDSGSDVDDSVLQSLGRQRASMLDQIDLEKEKAEAERKQSVHRVDGLGAELAALQTELAAQRERTQVARRPGHGGARPGQAGLHLRRRIQAPRRTICWRSDRARLRLSARSPNARAW